MRWGNGLTGGREFPARCARDLIDGESPVVGDDEGDVDNARTTTENSRAWSSASDSFRGEAGEWLEMTAASGVIDDLAVLRFWTDSKYQRPQQGERGRERPEGRTGILGRGGYRRNSSGGLSAL
jgi:hypothetical protein